MQRECKNTLIVAEDGRSAISLMHIEIDDSNTRERVPRAEPFCSNGQIVEHAETCAFISKRVMSSAGQRGAAAALKCGHRCGEGASDAGERSINQSTGPGESDAAD